MWVNVARAGVGGGTIFLVIAVLFAFRFLSVYLVTLRYEIESNSQENTQHTPLGL